MKKYKIIYADPPWKYDSAMRYGVKDKEYKVMTLQDICKLPIKDITDNDCILFIWATYPKLKEALEVIDAWGFNYRSIAFQWIKKNKSGVGNYYGMGYWTRGNTEPCLLATKGKPKRINNDVFQIVESRLRKHSQKPDMVYTKIERLMGDLSRIELFAREKKEGWDSAYSNELPDTTQTNLCLNCV